MSNDILTPHTDQDPNVRIELRASEWIKIINDRRHYFSLLEAFDPGGKHRTESLESESTAYYVLESVRSEVRRVNGFRSQ